ncbi:MAG: hypothetical protein V3S25_11095 [Nitrospirales bacterium]
MAKQAYPRRPFPAKKALRLLREVMQLDETGSLQKPYGPAEEIRAFLKTHGEK